MREIDYAISEYKNIINIQTVEMLGCDISKMLTKELKLPTLRSPLGSIYLGAKRPFYLKEGQLLRKS